MEESKYYRNLWQKWKKYSLSDAEIKVFENKVYDTAFEYEMMLDDMISVNIKNEEHFNYWLGALPYYNNIKKEGIVLAR